MPAVKPLEGENNYGLSFIDNPCRRGDSVRLPGQERYSVSYGGFAGYHAPLWAAKDLGLFAKHGLNADPVMIAGSARGMQALLSGSTHFALADSIVVELEGKVFSRSSTRGVKIH